MLSMALLSRFSRPPQNRSKEGPKRGKKNRIRKSLSHHDMYASSLSIITKNILMPTSINEPNFIFGFINVVHKYTYLLSFKEAFYFKLLQK